MTIDDKEWQEFITDCKLYKNKVDDLVAETKEQEKRISSIERENAETTFQYKSIIEKLDKLEKSFEKTISTFRDEIKEIKEKPTKRYETIVTAIITGVIGIVTGFLGSRIFK